VKSEFRGPKGFWKLPRHSAGKQMIMKANLTKALIMAAMLLAGCTKSNEPTPTTATNTTSAVIDKATAQAPPSTSASPKKKFENMTALEVAQDPAAYEFKKGGSMVTSPNALGLSEGLKPSRDDQWTKDAADGKAYILTIHYEDDKIVYAKWGGFNP
jgi:hypothetical protein